MNNRILRIILEYTAHDKIEDAARAGNIRCLKFLRKQGCPWDVWTCNIAAAGGHLDCLRYLHENGLSTGGRSMGKVGM